MVKRERLGGGMIRVGVEASKLSGSNIFNDMLVFSGNVVQFTSQITEFIALSVGVVSIDRKILLLISVREVIDAKVSMPI